MNPRLTTVITGLIILALGLASLAYPDRVLGVLGLMSVSASQQATLVGEVRATYGGLFVIMGIFTLLSALDPIANRGRVLFIGLMWLGAGAGRLVGVVIDGSPGLLGWGFLVLEVLIGGALLAAVLLAPKPSAADAAPPPQA